MRKLTILKVIGILTLILALISRIIEPIYVWFFLKISFSLFLTDIILHFLIPSKEWNSIVQKIILVAIIFIILTFGVLLYYFASHW